MRQEKLDEAVAVLWEAIRLEPDNAGHHFQMGFALASQGKLDDAITAFEEAIRLEPGEAFYR